MIAEMIAMVTDKLGAIGMFLAGYHVQYFAIALITFNYIKNIGSERRHIRKGLSLYHAYKDEQMTGDRESIEYFLQRNNVRELYLKDNFFISGVVRTAPITTLIGCIEHNVWVTEPFFFWAAGTMMGFSYTLLQISLVYKFSQIFTGAAATIVTGICQFWWIIIPIWIKKKFF